MWKCATNQDSLLLATLQWLEIQIHSISKRNRPQCDAREFPAQSMMEEDQKITPLRLKAQKTSFLDYRVATSPMYLLLSTYVQWGLEQHGLKLHEPWRCTFLNWVLKSSRCMFLNVFACFLINEYLRCTFLHTLWWMITGDARFLVNDFLRYTETWLSTARIF